MTQPAKPNDFLHRYVLRRGALRKARHRAEATLRDGLRDPFADAATLLPDARAILDVGANIGYVAHGLHKRWPKARITCFEPTPETFARLRANVADIRSISCVQAAVSDRDGTAIFHVDNTTFGGGANSLLDHAEEFDLTTSSHSYQPIEVDCVRLDTWCKDNEVDHVDVMKLDIEGAEPLAIRGAEGLLRRSAIDIVVSEARLVAGYDGGVRMHELVDLFDELGYRPFGVYRFARSKVGQSLWGDVMFLGPALRSRLIAEHGAEACGFLD